MSYSGYPPQVPPTRSHTGLWVTLAIVLTIVLMSVVGVAVGGFLWWRSQDTAATAVTGPGEVLLEPAMDAGPATFGTPGVAATALPVPSSVVVPTGGGITTARGATPGLYGGTGSDLLCDRAQMSAYLMSNPAKAAAWVGALNTDPTLVWSGNLPLTTVDIPAYLAELTPVYLLNDVRVTNFGFSNGVATPRQSVLQAGTSVLVDTRGVPRARCLCGNPLTAPSTNAGVTSYVGTRWANFSASQLVSILASKRTIVVFTLVDMTTGQPFERPVGTTLVQPVQPTPTPTPTPSPEPTQDLAAFCESSINFFTGVDTDYLLQQLQFALPNAPSRVQPAIEGMIDELQSQMSGGEMDVDLFLAGKSALAEVTMDECGYIPEEYRDSSSAGGGEDAAMFCAAWDAGDLEGAYLYASPEMQQNILIVLGEPGEYSDEQVYNAGRALAQYYYATCER